MSKSRRSEERYLTADERTLVDRTRGEPLKELPASELRALSKLLRERRRRARDISDRQRREMRGKAEPAGAAPAAGNEGTRRKAEFLTAAVKRLNREHTRRSAKAKLVDAAQRALALKRAAGPPSRPESRTAGTGLHPIENTRAEDLTRPMEVGRVSQFVRNAQVKKDARR